MHPIKAVFFTLALTLLSVGLSGCGARRSAMPPRERLVIDVNARRAAIEASLKDVKAATAPKVEGTIHVEEADFPVEHCSSGQIRGFSGIDLTSGRRRVRIVSELDGKTTIIYFADQDGEGTVMRGCAHLSLKPTAASVNFITVVTGTAEVDCRAQDVHVDGALTFQCSR
jgi:hypothetical protein